jgi:hypothetical protein
MLPDGRVLYMRWEYVDRNQTPLPSPLDDQSRRDGRDGLFRQPVSRLRDDRRQADPRHRQDRGLVFAGPRSGEHMGYVTIVDPNRGPDDMEMARRVSEAATAIPIPFRRPVPGRRHQGCSLPLMEKDGRNDLPPRVAGERTKATSRALACLGSARRSFPAASTSEQPTGRRSLRRLSRPQHGGRRTGRDQEAARAGATSQAGQFLGRFRTADLGGTFTLQRVLGTVPVEPDGSAYFEVPALRPLFFVALDENDMSVKRMQSFVTVQPGETTVLRRLPRAANSGASRAAPRCWML